MDMDEPMTIKLDNSGENFSAENKYACQRTKRINIKYYFMRQHMKDGRTKMELIRLDDNVSDILKRT